MTYPLFTPGRANRANRVTCDTAMRRASRFTAALMAALCLLVAAGCAQLPSPADRPVSSAFTDTAGTFLGRAIAPVARAHPGRSGVVAIPRGIDAFAARDRLADVAERSLDVQYYIWQNDLSGKLLMTALQRAAERGVRVRLLLDDSGTTGLDAVLAELSAKPNIEVRLFNPFASRRFRALGYLTDFDRANRRMHNKSFTADNQVTIVGGRNVGDEYFGVSEELQFVDLDVMAVGDVVHAVSNDFDRYWASDSAFPAEQVLRRPATSRAEADATLAATLPDPALAGAYLAAIEQEPFVRDMVAERLKFEWARVQLVSDDPSKGEGEARDDQLLWSRLQRAMPEPKERLDLVSPYFVPEASGVAQFVALADRGVKVTVLTNSLEATDVAAVHSGYAKRRKPLLEGGVALFEMKRTPGSAPPNPLRNRASSGASLHAKTFVVDRRAVFVGSFNFDPRSARLNTELGFVIESPLMARSIGDSLTGSLAQRAYEVRLTPGDELEWVEQQGGERIVHHSEPGASFWRKLGVDFLSWLPIEWLL